MDTNKASTSSFPSKKSKSKQKCFSLPSSSSSSFSSIIQFLILFVVLSYCISSIILFHHVANDTSLNHDTNDYRTKGDKHINLYDDTILYSNHVLRGGSGHSLLSKSVHNTILDHQHQILKHRTHHHDNNKKKMDDAKNKVIINNHAIQTSMIDIQKNNNTDNEDKQKVVSILEQSGLTITPEILSSLPTWSEIKSLYGPKPIIHGLETCSKFRQSIPSEDAYIGGSGMFNTGTNLLADLLLKYCKLEKRIVTDELRKVFGEKRRLESGMLWHVPWGKHNPISWRTHHKAVIGSAGIEQTHVLPIVTIKDPYHWMSSMCRHPYAAQWHHSKTECPNLVDPNTNQPNEVEVPFRSDNRGHYSSLVGLWNDWYSDYLSITDFPRLIIRYEDLLFHLEEVMTKVCECGGGTLINHEGGFVLNEDNAKAGHHNGSNGLLGAMLRYGNDKKRTESFTKNDISFAKKTLNKDLMNIFSYSYPKEEDE